MSPLTPEQEFAVRVRIAAIEAEMHAILKAARIAEYLRLCLEFNELCFLVGEITASESDNWAKELHKCIEENNEATEKLRKAQAEPTPSQQVLIDFAERLAARQGTIPPDFVALYKKKSDLDRRLTEE